MREAKQSSVEFRTVVMYGQTHFTLLGISVDEIKLKISQQLRGEKKMFWIDKGGAALMYTVLLGI